MVPSERQDRPGPPELQLALERDDARLRGFIDAIHVADLAHWMQDLDAEQVWRIWRLQTDEERAELIENAGDLLREQILERLSPEQLVAVVELMPTAAVVDLLTLTDEETTEQVLHGVDFERAQGLRDLLHYPEDSAGGLMTTDYLSVPLGTRIGDAIKEIKADEGLAGEAGEGLVVVDEASRPAGWISDRDLLTAGIHTTVDEVMEPEPVTVAALEDQEAVAHLVQKYDLDALPVVDERGALIGVVHADAVLDVLEEEAEEDLMRLVGTSPEEQTRLPVLTRVRTRLPLQALTVVGGLSTARILAWALPGTGVGSGGSMEILRYVPIIVGLAGNVGIQSSTILVRAFATGEVGSEREGSVLKAEVTVGLLIGLICGLTTAVISSQLESVDGVASWGFGLALGTAIAVAVSWASFLGCSVPMICRRFGIDPAVVAGPFLVALSDVSGASIFVGVAHLMLRAASA